MVFCSNEHLSTSLKYLNEIGMGAQGVVYTDNYRNRVYKIFHQFFESEYTEEKIKFTSDDLLKFKDVKTKTFYFPDELILVNDEIVGYASWFAPGKSLYEINPFRVNLNNFLEALKVADKDMDYISDKGIMTYDVAYNILYGKKKLSIIDSDEYVYSSDPDIKALNRENLKISIFWFLTSNCFEEFISDKKLLNEIMRDPNASVVSFLKEFKSSLENALDKDITTLLDARDLVNKNKHPKNYIRRLSRN